MKKIANWSFKKHIILSACITLGILLIQVLGDSLIIRILLGTITKSDSFSVDGVASIGII